MANITRNNRQHYAQITQDAVMRRTEDKMWKAAVIGKSKAKVLLFEPLSVETANALYQRGFSVKKRYSILWGCHTIEVRW
jgi:hypothetical protein